MNNVLLTKPKALIVDDEKSICESLAGVLSDEGWESSYALSGKEGIKKFTKDVFDLVLLDVWMEGLDGIETLQKLKELNSQIPIVIMSGHGTIETAVRATKLGAFDYLEKPLSLDKILPILEHAINLKNTKTLYYSNANQKYELIGNSPQIEEIKKQLYLIAPKNACVLITGENGTGKEVLAHMIHQASTRSKFPFVAINCAAIPEELIESELFGYEKGAFTNAYTQKKGKFEMAHKGTIFLDEIADMSLKTQAKILRIIQEKKFERLGGQETIEVDVRIIAATNKNLHTQIKNGEFREDLYYRLNVIPIHIPPLKERKEDIIPLSEYFLKVFAIELGEPKKYFTPKALEALLYYDWGGNVRELKNMIERLYVLVPKTQIDITDLPEPLKSIKIVNTELTSQANLTLKQAKSDFEKTFILKKLEENDWNISKTAESIGIERSHLHKKLKIYDIDLKNIKEG